MSVALFIHALRHCVTCPTVTKGDGPASDSMKENSVAQRTLEKLLRKGAIQPGDGAARWYNDIKYAAVFSKVSREKFRKFYDAIFFQRFGQDEVRTARKRARTDKLFLIRLFYFLTCVEKAALTPRIVGVDDGDDSVDDDEECDEDDVGESASCAGASRVAGS